jgi:hypothetical protein
MSKEQNNAALEAERVAFEICGVTVRQNDVGDWEYMSEGYGLDHPDSWHSCADVLGPFGGSGVDNLLSAYAELQARAQLAAPANQQGASFEATLSAALKTAEVVNNWVSAACSECKGTGVVIAESGDGPFDCYQCKQAQLADPAGVLDELRAEAENCLFVLREIGNMDAEEISGDDVDLRFEDADGRDTGCDVSIVEYAERAAKVIRDLLNGGH